MFRDEGTSASVLGRRAARRSGSGAVLTIVGMLTWSGEGLDQVPDIPVSTPTPNHLSTALMNAQLFLSQDEKTISVANPPRRFLPAMYSPTRVIFSVTRHRIGYER
jgi:hypothetical protein